jgi:hypothetical protein
MSKVLAPNVIGWREWVRLPGIGIPAVKAKIDTGARTSALHAFAIEPFRRGARRMARFGVHPLQRRTDIELWCEAEVTDERMVMDSGGHRERRLVICTAVALGREEHDIELTLTARDDMTFRMLLGRTAMQGRWCVDPGRSFLAGRRRVRYAGEGTRVKRTGSAS